MNNLIPPIPAQPSKGQPAAVEGQFDQNKPINADLLHEELKAALGDKYLSSDTGVPVNVGFGQKTVILIRLAGNATDEDKAKADKVVEAHDANQLSKPQQREKNRAEAAERLATVDFSVLRQKNSSIQIEGILDILQDICKVLRKED